MQVSYICFLIKGDNKYHIQIACDIVVQELRRQNIGKSFKNTKANIFELIESKTLLDSITDFGGAHDFYMFEAVCNNFNFNIF